MAYPCRSVMVVENDRSLLDLLVDYFESEGVEVVGVEGAEEALGRLRAAEHLPEVILIDLRMPRVSGEELLARLHDEPAWAGIPVAVMSGDLQRLEFTRREGVPLLAKPFTIEELNDALARQCGRSDASP